MKTITKHINFVKEIYVQAFKQLKEYSVNFWSVFVFDIVLFFVYLLFYSVILGISSEFLPWNFLDFILFYFSISLITKLTYFFRIKYFSSKLINGDLNVWRTKPINTFIAISMQNKDSAIYTTFLYIFPLGYIFYIGDNSNYFLAFLLLFFSLIYYIFFIAFFQSLAFFIKRNEVFVKTSNQLHYLNEQFTPKVFEKSLLVFLYFLPSALFGYFFIEFLNERFEEFFKYNLGIGLSFLFFIFGTYILWKVGLKKYEAFG